MGERKDRRLRREAMAAAERDKIEKEAAENQAAEAQPVTEVPAAEVPPAETPAADVPPKDDSQRENAPRKLSARPEAEGAKGKRRRRARINLQAAVVLLVVALVFGVVLGYAVGRNAGDKRAREAEALLAEANAALEAQRQAEAEVVSAQQAEDENAAALAALSGEDGQPDGDADLLMALETFPDGTEADAGDDEEVVAAEFQGGQLLGSEVLDRYNAEMARYAFEGYSEADVGQNLLNQVMEDMVYERVLEAHARELGVYELSDADGQRIAAEAQERYAEQLRACRDAVRTEDMSDAEAEEAAKTYLLETEGVTLESVEAELKDGWWMDKLFDALTADATVSAGDIVTVYNETLADQQQRFPENPEEYEAARLSGEVIAYNLPGYREVKMICLPFESYDALAAVDDLTLSLAGLDAEADAAQIVEIQAQIDACYAPLEAQAEQLLKELESGASFDSLMAQRGDDAETCYLCADSSLWTQAVIDGAMALGKPGDVSAAIRTDDGVRILQYAGDVPAGVVSMNDIYDAVSAQTLETARQMAFETQVNAWMDAAGAKYYPERLQ